MKNSHRNRKSCPEVQLNPGRMNYPPDLTALVREQIEQEIAAFDKKHTLQDIEQNAVGGPAAAGYAEWQAQDKQGILQGNEGQKYKSADSAEANPDILSEEEIVNLTKPDLPHEFVEAKKEINEILSFRELQVWRLIMRQGCSCEQTASLLKLSSTSVTTYLKRAKIKVYKHFKGR